MPNQWAIIVGIDRYHQLARLRNAVADAESVKAALIQQYGFDRKRIRLLTDKAATRAAILKLINIIVPTRWRVGREDQLLFFFAGHGGKIRKKARHPWYLATVDSRRTGSGTIDLDSVVTRDDVRKVEETFGGAHIFYIFDCCYSGMAFMAAAKSKEEEANRSACALVAGKGGEPVWDEGGNGHSIFTESLLDALGGWGGINTAEDGSFQADDLIHFIRTDVPRQIRRRDLKPQRPFGGLLFGNTEDTQYRFTPMVPRLAREFLEPLVNSSVHVRSAGVRQLGDIQNPTLLQVKLRALKRLVRDDSPSVRREVIAQLTRMTVSSSIELILVMAKDDDEGVALEAVRALGRVGRGDPRALTALRQLRDGGTRRFRRAVNFSLTQLGVKGAVKNVLSDLPEEEGSIRREIIDLMRELSGTAISKRKLGELLVDLLRRDDWRTRRAAAEALGELGIELGEPTLKRLMTTEKEHFMVRYSAAEALGQLGNTASESPLSKVLKTDQSLLVRSAAAEALGTVGGDGAVNQLTSSMIADPEWRVRRAAAESCGLLHATAAAGALQSATADPHFRVRMAVVWALGEIMEDDTSVTETLEQVSVSDLSLHVRRAAERALEHEGRA